MLADIAATSTRYPATQHTKLPTIGTWNSVKFVRKTKSFERTRDTSSRDILYIRLNRFSQGRQTQISRLRHIRLEDIHLREIYQGYISCCNIPRGLSPGMLLRWCNQALACPQSAFLPRIPNHCPSDEVRVTSDTMQGILLFWKTCGTIGTGVR